MDWRDRLGPKLVPTETAVKRIGSGDTVAVAPYTCTPHTLCGALFEHGRQGNLERVRVEHLASLFSWTEPDARGVFELRDNYATPPNREACHAGEMEYLPVGLWKSYELPPGVTEEPDAFLVPVSPPDDKGYCSFGPGVWMSGTMVRNARCVIAEVQPDFIRTYGENYVHVDQIDLFIEGQVPSGSVPTPPPNPEEVEAVEAICTQVAAELVNDGDTVQMGVGTVSASLGRFLDFRNDLGVQTELITGGIVDLVRQGVITGRRKTLHPHKVVGSAIVALDREELEGIHDNPVFELYDFGYTDDLRRLIQQENFVAVNNALVVDLSGQVAAEAFDHRMYTGVGGQTVFMIAGAYSPGGKSVSVLPSSSVPTGSATRVSRIVPALAPGTPVTVPRTYVDYVVTEHGIAELRGRTLRERARALIEVAHPDFRDELGVRARELYGV
jgi:4-hydroxybutyrate CoA-transferase